MRNLKKFLALVLATLMVISAAATVSAYSDVADDNTYAAAINALTEYGIVNGIGDDKFGPDNDVVRYQMAIMMARALEPKTTDWQNGMAIFEDVTEWYGAIGYAYMNGIVTGMDATHFEPYTGIKCRDALIMAVRALGYKVDTTLTPYWIGAYQTAAKLGLTKDLQVTDPAKTLTRAETAQVIYNMLKATPADGGATIEAKNFGASTEKNTTTAVITATSKQAFDGDVVLADDSTYVTLQVLNADGTLGGGFYAKFADLGFDEGVVADDVIGYSVKLVNFDSGKFDKSVPNAAKIVTTNDDDVTVSSDKKKVTIDKKVYWLVDEYSTDSIKNEIIVKTDDGRVATSLLDSVSKFYYDKDLNIVAPNNSKSILAWYVKDMKAANGQSLYALVNPEKAESYRVYTANELLNEKDIADAYNDVTSVDGYADLDKVTEAVQLTLFDDNGDGAYDRAISTPIYMSVFNTKKSDGQINIESNANGLKTSTKDVTVVSAKPLTKGDIFYYTYNKQTKTINVLGTVAMEYGTINSINFTDSKAENFTIKISGTNYKFGSLNQASAVFGANLAKTANAADKLTGIDKIVSEPALDFVNYTEFANAASIGATVKFYAYNGYIIYAESYDVEEAYNLIAVKNMIDVDNDGLIADIYVDGKLVEDAVISEVINITTGKTVKLSNLSTLAFSRIASQYFDSNNYIFKGIKLEDGSYRLGVTLYNATKKALNTEKIVAPTSDNGFAMTSAKATDVEFLDGISTAALAKNKIRTNDSTVFYFIKDGKLTVVQTSGKDYVIKGAEAIYVDKLGYSGDYKGVATKVIVYNYASVEGFGIAATVNATVFVPQGLGDPKANYVVGKYSLADAKELGLDGYEGAYYYYKNIAIDMSNGNTVAELYSDKPLTAGKFYQVDTNNVVIEGKATVIPANRIGKDYVVIDDQYKSIYGVFGTEAGVTTIKAIEFNKKEAKTVSNADAAKLLAKGTLTTVYYLVDEDGDAIDLKDGIFVMVVGEADTSNSKVVTITAEGFTEDSIPVKVVAKDDNDNTVQTITIDENGTYYFTVDKSIKWFWLAVSENGTWTWTNAEQTTATVTPTR